MNVAIYLRVSTDDQDTRRQATDAAAWCTAQGHTACQTFTDKASGADSTRHGRANLMRRAKLREFDAVVVTELSRWSRSVPDLLSTLETLAADGVRLIALSGPDFDIGKPLGKMMLTVLGAVAEFERGLIAERISSGIAAKKARGEHVGRQHGTDYRTQAVMKALQAIPGVQSTMSERALAKTLNCSRGTLARARELLAKAS